MADQSSFVAILQRARKAFSRSRFSEAENCYLSLLEAGMEREGVLVEMYQLYQKSGQKGSAIRCLEDLVQVNASSVDYVVRLASEYKSAGLPEASVKAYQKALSLNPELPNCLFNMALQLKKLGRLRESAAAYEEALLHKVGGKDEVYNNLALVYSELNQPKQAAACFEQALAINPSYIPALFNRAGFEEEWGHKDKAKVLYQKVLALDSGYYPALSRLLYMTEFRSPDNPIISRVRSVLQTSSLPSLECEELWFAMGKAMDECGEYDSAFQAYTSANRIGSGRFKKYRKDLQEKAVGDIMDTFSGRPSFVSSGASELKPIFICGMLRSGSTLLERVLSGHSRISAGGELEYIPRIVEQLGEMYPGCLKAKGPQFFDQVAIGYEKFLQERLDFHEYFIDKRPDNFLHIGLIKAVFPGAKIIWSRRGLKDNCLSIYFQQLGAGMSYSVSLDWIGHFYHQHLRLMNYWRAMFPDSICEVSYEDFVNSPEEEVQKLLSFIGVDWEDSCLDFSKAGAAVRTASIWQVQKPLYRNSSGRYMNYEKYLEPLDKYV